MKMLLLLTILVAIVCGYFYYDFTPPDAPTEVTVAELSDTPVEPVPLPTQSAPAQIAMFENDAYNFTFKYRIKPYGYSVFENTPQQNADIGALFGTTFVRSDDYNESVKAAAEGNAHDGPPSMSVYVFEATNVRDVSTWLTQNKMLTNCEPGTVGASEIDGKDAFSCLWDGLYLGVTVAVLHETKLYVLIGTREGAETPDGYSYEKDFNGIVESFKLTN